MLMLQGEQEPQTKVHQSCSGFRNLQVFRNMTVKQLLTTPGDNNHTCLFKGLGFLNKEVEFTGCPRRQFPFV